MKYRYLYQTKDNENKEGWINAKSRENAYAELRKAGIHLADEGWDINVPNAYYGDDPYGCTETIGRAAIRIETEKLARAVRAFKEDDYLLDHLKKMQKGWN